MTPSTRRPRGTGALWQAGDGHWEAVAELGTDAGGKRRRKVFRGRSAKEANDRRREYLDRRARGEGEAATTTRLNVAGWMERWLAGPVEASVAVGSRAPGTAQSYRHLYQAYIKPTLGAARLEKLTTADVDQLVSTLAAAGYKPNTIRLARACLRTALNAAVGEGLLARNPVERSVAPRVATTKHRRTLTLEEARRLLGSLEEEPLGPLIELALWTGMRKGELLGLLWEDVDVDAAVVHVRAGLTRVTGRGLVRGRPKTEESADSVPLVGSAVAALRRQRSLQAERRLALGKRWQLGEYVFHGPRGGALDPAAVTRGWNSVRDRLGLPVVSFHDLRHTTATLLLNDGVPLVVVSQILRHASIRITADVYAEVGDSLRAEALARLERLLTEVP